MKKNIYTLLIVFTTMGNLAAQYCGNSGAGQCTPLGGMSQPGLSPRSDSLPPFINGIQSNTIIQFKNFDQVFFNGTWLTVQSLRIDSIENLPAGLCWATNKTTNTYANQEDGCIKVNGTPCAAPGQYKLRIIVTVNVGIPFQVNAASAGLNYYVRVGNYGDVVPPADTLQAAEFYNVGYSPTANCSPVICSQFTFTQSSIANTSCSAPTGSLSVSATGGTAPYTYHLGSTSNNSGTFTGLQGGTYDVIAVDSNSCRDTVSVTVSATTPTITMTTILNSPQTSCTGPDGSLSLSASGGTLPYTYVLGTDTNSTGSFTGLPVGNYVITAIDANACTGTKTENIADSVPVVTITTAATTAQTSCITDNGSLTLAANGGLAPYTYVLGTDTNFTGIFTGLGSGAYAIKATDVNGCIGLLSTSVADSVPVLALNFATTNASSATANDGSAVVAASGGTAPYSFVWSNSQTGDSVSALVAGSYSVTVSDAAGCSAIGNVTVGFTNSIGGLGKEFVEFRIFPNPVADNLTVDARLVNSKNVTIEIYDALGAKVMSRNAGYTDHLTESFSMKGLPKGTYLVVIAANGMRSLHPVIVE